MPAGKKSDALANELTRMERDAGRSSSGETFFESVVVLVCLQFR